MRIINQRTETERILVPILMANQYPISTQSVPIIKNVKNGKNVKKNSSIGRKAPRRDPYPIYWNKEHEEFHGIDCPLCECRDWKTQHKDCGLQKLKAAIRKRYSEEFDSKWLNAVWESIHDWVETKLEEDGDYLKKYKSLGLFVLGWYRREAERERKGQ